MIKTVVVWMGSQTNANVIFIPELNLNWNHVTFRTLGVECLANVHETVLTDHEYKLKENKKAVQCLAKKEHHTLRQDHGNKTMVISK